MELYQLNPLYWLKRGARRVHHIAKWLPVLWSDNDWDYLYLYQVMQFKIKCMREHQLKHRIIVDYKKVAHRMFVAEQLLKRLLDQDYVTKEYEDYHERHPHVWEESPRGMILKGDPAGWPELKKLHEKEKYLEEQDLDYLFKILRKYIRTWWD